MKRVKKEYTSAAEKNPSTRLIRGIGKQRTKMFSNSKMAFQLEACFFFGFLQLTEKVAWITTKTDTERKRERVEEKERDSHFPYSVGSTNLVHFFFVSTKSIWEDFAITFYCITTFLLSWFFQQLLLLLLLLLHIVYRISSIECA